MSGNIAIFFREVAFYPVMFSGTKPAAEEAADHAELNPGTLRIEDLDGNALWAQEPTP